MNAWSRISQVCEIVTILPMFPGTSYRVICGYPSDKAKCSGHVRISNQANLTVKSGGPSVDASPAALHNQLSFCLHL